MTIDDIRWLCKDETLEITKHALMRMHIRNIAYDEIMQTIMVGSIIEDYPDAYPYPACLILGKTNSNKIIHVVVGIGDGRLWIISAYEPDISKWEMDFRTRKKSER